MRLPGAALVLTIAVAPAPRADTAVAADVGYAGAFRAARDWIVTNGGDPDDYTIRADEDVCSESERAGAERCYFITAWP